MARPTYRDVKMGYSSLAGIETSSKVACAAPFDDSIKAEHLKT